MRNGNASTFAFTIHTAFIPTQHFCKIKEKRKCCCSECKWELVSILWFNQLKCIQSNVDFFLPLLRLCPPPLHTHTHTNTHTLPPLDKEDRTFEVKRKRAVQRLISQNTNKRIWKDDFKDKKKDKVNFPCFVQIKPAEDFSLFFWVTIVCFSLYLIRFFLCSLFFTVSLYCFWFQSPGPAPIHFHSDSAL